MADEIKPKEGKEFWEFVRRTAEEVSKWPECNRADAAVADVADERRLVQERQHERGVIRLQAPQVQTRRFDYSRGADPGCR